MKKYIVTLLIALFLVTIPSAKAITKPEVTDHEKVKIHVFWASWCPHCHDLIEYFSDKYDEYSDYFEFVTYQVDLNGKKTTNSKNATVMTEVQNVINKTITDEKSKLTGGIPLIVIGDSFHMAGFGSDGTELIEKALSEYQNANYSDLVEKVIADKKIETDAKTFQEACTAAGITCKGVESQNKKLSDGVIAGIIIGIIVLGFGGLVYYSRKN